MSDTLVLDRIQTSLTRLRLPRMGEILESVTQVAEEGSKSYLSFLDALLEEEVGCREQRRVETSLKISGLPFIKSIDEFDFAFQPKLDRQKVMSLFDLTFIQQKGNVIFLGPPGVGKTHLAVSLALKACQAGMSIYFTTMEDLIGKLKKDHDAERKGRGRSYNKSALVISWMRLAIRRSAEKNAISFSDSLPIGMRRPAPLSRPTRPSPTGPSYSMIPSLSRLFWTVCCTTV